MKVVLAGAFGHTGTDLLNELVKAGHNVVALDLKEKDTPYGSFEFKEIDACRKETLLGTCDGADIVISTIGLTSANTTFSNYDIDLNGNLNLLGEAKRANVKKFIYISHFKADDAKDIPLLDAKAKFEKALKNSGLKYLIFRPTRYFHDLEGIFMPMVEKGKVTLLGKKVLHVNPISTYDLATFIVSKLDEENKVYSIGGKERYTYYDIASLFFEAKGMDNVIKYMPPWIYSIVSFFTKDKSKGEKSFVKYYKWAFTNDLEADEKIGSSSFREYVFSLYKKCEE